MEDTIEIDENIFKTQNSTDIHGRGTSCTRTIKGIRKNELVKRFKTAQMPHWLKRERILTPKNQRTLLLYAKKMSEEIIGEKQRSLASFEKNLNEAWIFCLAWNKDLDKDTLSRAEVTAWWKETKKPYLVWLQNGTGKTVCKNKGEMISWGTLRKRRECASTFLKFLKGLKKRQLLEEFLDAELPPEPKKDGKVRQPSSQDVKQLFQSMKVDGKKMSIRDFAALFICYDVGSRIAEPLSMRCSDLWLSEDGKYYCIHFPESKSLPRTVISYLAKTAIDEWLKVRPGGYNPKSNDYLFCKEDGKSPISYASVTKTLKRALKISGIPWKDGKAAHYFRTLFNTRARNWGYLERYRFLGRTIKGSENAYIEISPEQFEKPYFDMLRTEKNAMLPPQDLGIVEKKESVYVDKVAQKQLITDLLAGKFQAMENKMLNLLLEKRKTEA